MNDNFNLKELDETLKRVDSLFAGFSVSQTTNDKLPLSILDEIALDLHKERVQKTIDDCKDKIRNFLIKKEETVKKLKELRSQFLAEEAKIQRTLSDEGKKLYEDLKTKIETASEKPTTI